MATRPWTIGLATALAGAMLIAGLGEAQARHPRRWVDGSTVSAKALSPLVQGDKAAVVTRFEGESKAKLGIVCANTKKGLACAAVDKTGKVLDDSVRYQARHTPRGTELAFMVEIDGVQFGVQSKVGSKARKGVSKMGLNLREVAAEGSSTSTLTALAFRPDAPSKELIAHELTHVVQQ